MRRRIAIVGSGVSGLVAAHLLHRQHDITVLEAADYVGGHVHTIDVDWQGRRYPVDTGFIVFNDRTYPNFRKLLSELQVASQPTTMSFSVQDSDSGLEYSGTSLNTLFAQRRNLLRPSFYRMLKDIMRFNKQAPADLGRLSDEVTLGAYLDRGGFSQRFVEHYIVPMGAAIWSADPASMFDFPAAYFIRFFHNHGMLSVRNRPVWHVVQGGSRTYVDRLIQPFKDRIQLATPVTEVRRLDTGVAVIAGERELLFDEVVLAVHSDQALRMISKPSQAETEVLGAILYQENEAVLHTDQSLMPRRQRAWAAWNYHVGADRHGQAALTYNMNILQGLDAPVQFCVTLNRASDIHADSILRRITYHHPVYDRAAVAAQRRHAEINGVDRLWYCGAYWGFGFHEDGVKSGLAVCRGFGLELGEAA